MILVSTGTNGAPFDRLLSAFDNFPSGEEIIVQHGPSSLRPAGATCVYSMPFQEFRETAARARVVVTHAGVGSTLIALLTGHRPVLVPRLSRFGEAVDDHQLELGKRLEDIGVATLIVDTATIATVVAEASEPTIPWKGGESRLLQALEAYLNGGTEVVKSSQRRSRSAARLASAIRPTRN